MIRTSTLLVSLILVRTLSELGGGSTAGPLLPLKAISAAAASAIILLTILNYDRHFKPSRVRLPGAGIAAGAVTFWILVGFYRFGFDLEFFGELVRTIALIAIFVLSYQLGVESGSRLPRWLNWVVGLPAALLILGFIMRWEPTLSGATRAAGSFVHPNSAAAFFAVGTIACMWGYMQSRNRFSLAVMFASFIALLLTRSLGGLAALASGAFVFLALNLRLAASRRLLLILLSAGLGFTLVRATGVLERLSEFQNFRYRGNILGGTDSLNWRLVNWRQLLDIWADESPLFGFGWGSTRFEVLPLGSLPHNIYIQLLVETGAIGILLACAIFVAFIRSIIRRFKHSPQTAAALAAIGSVVLTHGLAANWLSYVPAQYLMLFAVGVIPGHTRPDRSGTDVAIANPLSDLQTPQHGMLCRTARTQAVRSRNQGIREDTNRFL